MKKTAVSNSGRMKAAIGFCFIFMAAFALSFAMYGTLLPYIIEHYGISLQEASMSTVTENIGNILAMVLTILVASKLSKPALLGAFVLLFGGMMFFMGKAPAYMIFLTLRMLLGMSCSILDNLSTAYMSDLSGENRGRNISILHMLYGIGCIIAPKFAEFVLKSQYSWNTAYLWFGALMLGLGLVFALAMLVIKPPVTQTGSDEAAAHRKIPYKEMLTSRNMRIMYAVSFFYAGFTYFSQFLQTYLRYQDAAVYTLTVGANVLMLFYIGMIVSRLLFALLAKKINYTSYLRWVSVMVAGLMLIGFLFGSKNIWMILGFSIGFINGPSHTAKFVLVCEEFPEDSSTIVALTAAASYVGNIVISMLVGTVADHIGYTAAMMICVVCMIITSVLMLGYKKSNTETNQNEQGKLEQSKKEQNKKEAVV